MDSTRWRRAAAVLRRDVEWKLLSSVPEVQHHVSRDFGALVSFVFRFKH